MQLKGWMGMIIGPIAGAGAYLKFVRRHGEPIQLGMLIGFVLIGLVAGLVIWGVDVMRSKKNS
jgi:hypothetical protein